MEQREAVVTVSNWEEVLDERNKGALEAALPHYLPSRRWFGAKARRIDSVRIEEAIPLSSTSSRSYIALISVHFAEGAPQTYVLPLSFAHGERAAHLRDSNPGAVVAHLQIAKPGQDEDGERDLLDGVLYDASWDKAFAMSLLEAIKYGRSFGSSSGEIRASATRAFAPIAGDGTLQLEPSIVGAEQSNTSVIYGDRFILKMFRRLEEGTSPDLEIGRFLGEKGFTHTPPLAGAIEHVESGGPEPVTMAILQGFVPNRGDAWTYTLEALDGYYDRALAAGEAVPEVPSHVHLLDLARQEVPHEAGEAIGPYLDSARLLGRRTAEMHLALASGSDDPAFASEPFTPRYQQALHGSIQGLVRQAFGQLRTRLDRLPTAAQEEARHIMRHEETILDHFQPLLDKRLSALRTRCHGDYHLGQVLYTGDDFFIIDFEGEPVRPLAERRSKHSPLKDVTGMLRSFHYAAYAALFGDIERGSVDVNDVPRMEKWADNWTLWVSAAFLGSYLEVVGDAECLPRSREDLQVLFDTYLMEKAVYELIYELNNRPDWVRIPLEGIEALAG